jgi:serine/threonine protein kinase
MAPEVTRGGNYDSKVDIFALGIILYQICSNQRYPYLKEKGNTTIQFSVAQDGLRPDVNRVEDEFKGFVPLMKRCWDEDPSKRPTADEKAREKPVVVDLSERKVIRKLKDRLQRAAIEKHGKRPN